MLNFEEFLFALRGRPNEERQNVIDYVYSIFDKENRGVADANEMRKVFNCQKHPKFKMGKLSESQMVWTTDKVTSSPFTFSMIICPSFSVRSSLIRF